MTAQLCIETATRVIRLVRRAIREAPDATLSLSRVRALGYLADNRGVCLSDLADHLIVGAPTASKLVDDLVVRGLLTRSADAADRRRLELGLTAAGREVLKTAARPAQDRIAELLGGLSEAELERVRGGLESLLPVLVAAAGEVANE